MDVERIRKIPISDVAADLGFRLTARGSGLCRLPGHEDRNPSFALRLRSNGFQCYACRRGGSVIDLVMLMEGLEFVPACGWLRERYLGDYPLVNVASRYAPRPVVSVSRPATSLAALPVQAIAPDPELYSWILDQSPLGEGGRAYLSARGFSSATLEVFRVGQIADRRALLRAAHERFGEGRLRRCGLLRDSRQGADLIFPSRYLLFPFLVDGDVSYLQARRADGHPDHRWYCPAKLLPPAFNVDVLHQGHATITICEGVTDALSAHELGRAAIGLIGAKAHLDLTTIERLRGHNVVLVGDRDPPGQAFARDIVRLLGRHGITAIARLLPDGANDLNDVLRQRKGIA